MSAGRFGIHGGQFIPETLMSAVTELETAYNHYKDDPQFVAELNYLFKEYTGRPSLLYYAEKMTKDLGGAKIYLKREDLNHTGSHKINNALGQVRWQRKWARQESLPRQVQDSTVSLLPQRPHLWEWSARSTWARRTRTVRP